MDNTTMNPIQEAKEKNLDELVRDFTQVQPRSKSEVRRKILEFANQIIQSCIEAAPGEKTYGGYNGDGIVDNKENYAYNEALSDFIAELKKGLTKC